jgi:effector-binding domain-containing protein
MSYVVESRILDEQVTAVRRATLPSDRVPQWLADTYSAVVQYLARAGVAATGPPFARYVMRDLDLAVEAGLPVAREIRGDGDIEPSTLPGGTVALTTHHGRYEALEDAYKALAAWIEEHGGTPADAHWEVYFSDPAREPDPARWRTDVVMPYV